MQKFLSAKPWQLFIFFICCLWTSGSPLKEIINGIGFFAFIMWINAIGMYGGEKVKNFGISPIDLKLFKLNITALFIILAIGLALALVTGEKPQSKEVPEWSDIILMLVGIYFAFAFIHVLYSACKTITQLEYSREVSFNDCLNNLFLILFFPIGVWFLQPKVQRLIGNE